MSEMLGNYYFHMRDYNSALFQLERVLTSPENKKIKKKLIICYAQLGRIDKSMDLFLELLREDPQIITSTDVTKDDCPCQEIILHLENDYNNIYYNFDTLTKLGILWLYCSKEKSYEFLLKARNENSENQKIQEAIKLIEPLIINNQINS